MGLWMFLSGCESNGKDHFVYGLHCKLWLLHDLNITPSGMTPFIICFDKNTFEDYSIKNNGVLKKRNNEVFPNEIFIGGTWKFFDDTLYLKNISIHNKYIIEDTIIVNSKIYLLNVTDKFNIENCNCENLVARFKGGKVDSIKQILNFFQ